MTHKKSLMTNCRCAILLTLAAAPAHSQSPWVATQAAGPVTSPVTPVSDPFRVVFSPVPDSFGAPYATLSFVASDGQYDSSPWRVIVTILPPPTLEAAGFAQSGNQGFALNFNGLSNAPYGVQASTNLVNWSRLGPASQPSPGQFFFLDPGATNLPRRFYRVTSP